LKLFALLHQNALKPFLQAGLSLVHFFIFLQNSTRFALERFNVLKYISEEYGNLCLHC